MASFPSPTASKDADDDSDNDNGVSSPSDDEMST